MQQTFRKTREAWGLEQHEKVLALAEVAGADGDRWEDEETGKSQSHHDVGADCASYWLPDEQAKRSMSVKVIKHMLIEEELTLGRKHTMW